MYSFAPRIRPSCLASQQESIRGTVDLLSLVLEFTSMAPKDWFPSALHALNLASTIHLVNCPRAGVCPRQGPLLRCCGARIYGILETVWKCMP